MAKEEVLNKQLNTYKTKISAVKSDQDHKLQQLQDKYDKESSVFRTEITDLKNKHEKAIELLKDEHRKQLDKMEKDKSQLEHKFSSEIESFKSKQTLNHQNTMKEMETGFEKQKEIAVTNAVANATTQKITNTNMQRQKKSYPNKLRT